jgi:uncharacterized protein
MFEGLLAQLNTHWTEERQELGVPRSCFGRLLRYLATGQVVAVTGVRRAGKSTLVRQLIDHLIYSQKVAPRQILFVNLEHPYLTPHREDVTALQRLYEDYLKMMQPQGEIYICLDEVQFFPQWPIFVKSLYELKKTRFVVTGSNAAMLSSDMLTLLSGRSLPLEVFPFSFREYAHSRKVDVDSPLTVAQQMPLVRQLFDRWLDQGGFPTVVLGDHEPAAEILGAHARLVLLQDVAPRLGVRKPDSLERLYVFLASNIGKLFTYSSLSKLFELSDKSIKEYLHALADAHLVYEVELFSYSLKQQIRHPKKVYSIDTGQANAVGFQFTANRGRLLENAIFIDFKRLGLETYYFKTGPGREVDFVIKSGKELSLVQVTWDLNDLITRECEVQALQEAMAELGCRRGIILVAEPPLLRESLGENISIVQAPQYLLAQPQQRKEQLFGV